MLNNLIESQALVREFFPLLSFPVLYDVPKQTMPLQVLAMYKTKIEKYGKIFDNKNVIPIIITPWLQMDPRSIIEMSRYCKPDKLFKSLSFWTIYMESQKLEKYSSYSKENNLNHFDTEVQRTAQAAQSSAKKAQTNNDEIVIEIELEDTLNRISQNETVPGTSQSKGPVTF
ncbi:Hypothetical_protein [Hexamita inflata]|uniref:Hypothetical_protein n=1 Tax=Hexamita inflata TaxID=28002 RepID=A0AA86PU65_9EUKA|nr:Hypothetical protein HINF_LOCUS33934 [Hexamita inflata]